MITAPSINNQRDCRESEYNDWIILVNLTPEVFWWNITGFRDSSSNNKPISFDSQRLVLHVWLNEIVKQEK